MAYGIYTNYSNNNNNNNNSKSKDLNNLQKDQKYLTLEQQLTKQLNISTNIDTNSFKIHHFRCRRS